MSTSRASSTGSSAASTRFPAAPENDASVQDVVVVVSDAALARPGFLCTRFSILLEQLSSLMQLSSHRRVPDFDVAARPNASVRFSAVTAPDAKAVEAARAFQAQMAQFYSGDDVRHLVEVAAGVTCHRALSGFAGKGGLAAGKLSLSAHIDAARDVSGAAAVRTVGPTVKRNEDAAAARERILDFAALLEGCMDAAKINASTSDSDSDDDESKNGSGDGAASGYAARDAAARERARVARMGVASRQVVVLSCGGFAFDVLNARCAKSAILRAAAGASGGGEGGEVPCFLWVRNRGQHTWYSPALWTEFPSPPPAAPTFSTPAAPTGEAGAAVAATRSWTDTLPTSADSGAAAAAAADPNAADYSVAFVEEAAAASSDAASAAKEPEPSAPLPAASTFKVTSASATTFAAAHRTASPDSVVWPANMTMMGQQQSQQSQQQSQQSHLVGSPGQATNATDESLVFEQQQHKQQPLKQQPPPKQPQQPHQQRRDVVDWLAGAPRAAEEVAGGVARSLASSHASAAALVSAPASAPVSHAGSKRNAEQQAAAPPTATRTATPNRNAAVAPQPQQASRSAVASSRSATPSYAASTVASSHHAKEATPVASATATPRGPLARRPTPTKQQPQQQQPTPAKPVAALSSRSTNNTTTAAATPAARKPSPTARGAANGNGNGKAKQQHAAQASSTVDLGPQRSGEQACMQLYRQAKVAVKRRSAADEAAEQRRRELEDEELRKARAPHPTLSMFNVGAAKERAVAAKIVHALRADPCSAEGLLLVPHLPDSIPATRVRDMVQRLVPPPPRVSKRFEQLQQQQQQQVDGGGAGGRRRTGSASRSATPPAWRGGGPVRTSSVSSASGAVSARGPTARSPSPVLDRLYKMRNATREAHEHQQKLQDAREIQDVIDSRKANNPHFAKQCDADPAIEELYRKRLLRGRVEERRLRERRDSAVGRVDPRFADAVAGGISFAA